MANKCETMTMVSCLPGQQMVCAAENQHMFMLREMVKGLEYALNQKDEHLRMTLESMNKGMLVQSIRSEVEFYAKENPSWDGPMVKAVKGKSHA